MLEIRQTAPGGALRDFLNVVDIIYKGGPTFVRPLDQDLKDRLSPGILRGAGQPNHTYVIMPMRI